ncbi:MAG: ABC transporter ATP-binding protein [Eubacteriales bacterium]|nr:ABC transporter ATP-binding protein [Eubacteriales bacterium]
MLVELKQVTKTFQRGGQEIKAVNAVDLNLEAGDFAHIIGRSGSGKTSLLNLIAGLMKVDSGTIRIKGQEIQNLDSEKLARFRNEEIGYIPQHAVLMESLNALENVLLPWYLYKREGDAKGRALYLFDKLDIRSLTEAYPNQLSGGELRRIQIARALMNDPKLLLADEPSSDLDIATTADLMNLLQDLNRDGLSLIVVTHELETLAYGKSVYTMTEGVLESGCQLELNRPKL